MPTSKVRRSFFSAQPKEGSALARGARTECDACVVRWTEAALSGPYWQSVQGERSSDVVASLPVGPGLVRARSDVGCSSCSNAVSIMIM